VIDTHLTAIASRVCVGSRIGTGGGGGGRIELHNYLMRSEINICDFFSEIGIRILGIQTWDHPEKIHLFMTLVLALRKP